jgi:hypothetical protein
MPSTEAMKATSSTKELVSQVQLTASSVAGPGAIGFTLRTYSLSAKSRRRRAAEQIGEAAQLDHGVHVAVVGSRFAGSRRPSSGRAR